MSRRIRDVERRRYALNWLAHTPVCKIELLNYARIENAHEVRKKTFVVLLFLEVQQTFSFLLPCWDISKYLLFYELVQQFYHAAYNGNVANAVRV